MLKQSIMLIGALSGCATAAPMSVYAAQNNYTIAAGETITVDIMAQGSDVANYAVAGFWLSVIGDSATGIIGGTRTAISVTGFELAPEFTIGSSGEAYASRDDLIGVDGGQTYFPDFGITPPNTSNPTRLFTITYTAGTQFDGRRVNFDIVPFFDGWANQSWYTEDGTVYGDYPVGSDADTLDNLVTAPAIYRGFTFNVPTAPTVMTFAGLGLIAGVRRRR